MELQFSNLSSLESKKNNFEIKIEEHLCSIMSDSLKYPVYAST